MTVDGSRGKIYRGLLPLVDVGGEIDVSKLPPTKTKVGLILADVGQSLFLSRLREVPDFEVGLLRAEFMLGNIGVHPWPWRPTTWALWNPWSPKSSTSSKMT